VGGMNRAGAETMLMNLYRKIDREKYQFDFICFTAKKCDYDDEIEALGGRIFRTQYFIDEKVSFFKRSFRFKKILNQEGPFHAIHSHTLFSSCFHLMIAGYCGISKRIAHSHSTSDVNSSSHLGRIYQQFSRWLIQKVATDYIACGSEASKFLFPNISSDKIHFLPNAINIESFINPKSYSLHIELGLSKEDCIILQIGRLNEIKNFEFSIGIAAYLKDNKICGYHFVFAGEGAYRQKLEALIKEKKLEEYVSFIGVRDDVPNLFSSADIMIMPSLYEGFPVVLVEAQASGLPSVISSNISNEVDMGFGLVNFCDLDNSYDNWFSEIKKNSNKRITNFHQIRKQLTLKGFSTNESSKKLQEIYG
jgi:glycosyltransferase EpsF